MVLKLVSRFKASPYAFPLAALTALAMFFISEASYRQAHASLDGLGDMVSASMAIQTLRRSLTDAETGQRGYLLTGRSEYLKPYDESLGDVQRSLEQLQRYYAADPAAAALTQRVRRLADEKLSELRVTLERYREGREETWRSLVLSNLGQEKMELVRDALAELSRLETARVEAGRKDIYQTLLLNRIGVSAMTALSLLALFMYLRQTDALERHRTDQQRVMRAERDQLEREVERRMVQLTALAQHLQTVREDERSHLARELHDELGALLTTAKLDVARLKSRLEPMKPEVTERLAHLNESLNSGIALKRRIIEDLRPSSLSNLGLVAALEILVQNFRSRSDIEVHTAFEQVRLSPAGELTVYRLVQEALTNIVKYARATMIEVTLERDSGRVRIAVQDNGVGFDVSRPRASAHGLLGMRYRVEAEGGRMALTSAHGKGTLIEAHLPELASDVDRPAESAGGSGAVDSVGASAR